MKARISEKYLQINERQSILKATTMRSDENLQTERVSARYRQRAAIKIRQSEKQANMSNVMRIGEETRIQERQGQLAAMRIDTSCDSIQIKA